MRLALILIGSFAGVLILLVVVAVVIGSRMPPEHIASQSLKLSRPPSEVYALVRNFGAATSWRPDVKRVEMLGPDKFREHGSNGAVTYQIVEDIPDRKIVTKIIDVDLGYSGTWEYSLQGSSAGTVVTITERGVVSNPMFRFMSRYIFGHTATIATYLKSLQARMTS